jgi:hypothetical protein
MVGLLIRDIFVLTFLAAGSLAFAGGKPQGDSGQRNMPVLTVPGDPKSRADPGGFSAPERAIPAADEKTPQRAETREADRGEQVMKALAAAYPDRIKEAAFRDGDWTAEIDGVRFYYAGGRLLPEELREAEEEYDPQPFYPYQTELPPWQDPGPEEEERFSASERQRRTNPPKRSQHFYDALWRAHSREESYERVKTIRFLGRSVLVHYTILEELVQVEELILREAGTDPLVREWMGSLETLSGWNWRSIAETESRSFHAYGAAIDLLPASLRGMETYWLWTARENPRWWAVPYTKRLHPPDKVIRAFESCGFIWGGKWLFFDTMHFEYRPEILILNGIGGNQAQ